MTTHTKMKPARKKELLKALRTPPSEGGYLQTSGTLYDRFPDPKYTNKYGQSRNMDHFCCLGVATDLMAIKGLLSWGDVASTSDAGFIDPCGEVRREDYSTTADYKGRMSELRSRGARIVPFKDEYDQGFFFYELLYEEQSLPGDKVLDYYGLSKSEAIHLAKMNDDGRTFAQIADWIEENL